MEGAASSLLYEVESRALSREKVYTDTQKEHLDTLAVLAELIVKHDLTSLQSNYTHPQIL